MFTHHHRGNIFFTFQSPVPGEARLNDLFARVQNIRGILLGQECSLRGDFVQGCKKLYSKLLSDREEHWKLFADYPREVFDMSVRESN